MSWIYTLESEIDCSMGFSKPEKKPWAQIHLSLDVGYGPQVLPLAGALWQPQNKVKLSWNPNRRLQFGNIRSSMNESWASLPPGQEIPLDALPVLQFQHGSLSQATPDSFHKPSTSVTLSLTYKFILVLQASLMSPGQENSGDHLFFPFLLSFKSNLLPRSVDH